MQDSGFIQKVFKKFDKLDPGKIKKIMIELSTEKELYRLVFESMIEGVIVTDRDNKIILINRAMEEFLAIPKERAYSQQLEYCNFDPEVKGLLDDATEKNERIIDREIHLGRTNKAFTLTVLPLLHNDENVGNIIILVDITEKKEREIQLRQAESLAALTTLSAGVAHEIKNPLASIDIHIQLLRKEIAKRKGENIKNMENLLVIVKEEIDRLNSIVQDFLFAVRPMNMNLSRESINEIIKEMMDFLKYELQEADISVMLEFEEGLPEVSVDPKYLKQALLNVVKNSIEALDGGGRLNVKTEEASDGDVLIHIIDNGKGIPENIMGKIFEPYFTTRNFGTGLGLVIVYKIIKELGGDIKVSSKENEGTAFSIKLPVLEKKKRLLTYEEKDESKAVSR
ncbi:MAG TPA: ATP-binding protein [Spirochaetota bacterium]|nr:ATP-binding protein [Spirochaetota bacterium]